MYRIKGNSVEQIKEIIKTLKAARDVIEPKGKWTKHALAKTYHGEVVDPESDLACRFCALGALEKVAPMTLGVIEGAQSFLSDAMATKNEFCDIPWVNDHNSTQQIHVLMSYDLAILMAQDELKSYRKTAKQEA